MKVKKNAPHRIFKICVLVGNGSRVVVTHQIFFIIIILFILLTVPDTFDLSLSPQFTSLSQSLCHIVINDSR